MGSNGLENKGAKIIAEALRLNKTLTEISLNNNEIRDEGATAIAEVLKFNRSLNEINLSSNQIGKDGIVAIADALKLNNFLTIFYFYGNKIGNEGAKIIAEALKFNKSLIEIDLAFNYIGNEGAGAIVEAIKSNNSLTTFRLYQLPKDLIKIDIIKSIEDKIQNNKQLVKKLAVFLKDAFLDEKIKNDQDNITSKNDPKIFIEIVYALKFYKKVDKKLFKEYLQEETTNTESIINKIDNFIKTYSFTIAGICKKIQPNKKIAEKEMHISKLPMEVITHITSSLNAEEWGWKVESDSIKTGNNNDEVSLTGGSEVAPS